MEVIRYYTTILVGAYHYGGGTKIRSDHTRCCVVSCRAVYCTVVRKGMIHGGVNTDVGVALDTDLDVTLWDWRTPGNEI